MSSEKSKVTLLEGLKGETVLSKHTGDKAEEAISQLKSDLGALRDRLEGLAFVEAFIDRGQRYAVECFGVSLDDDYDDIDFDTRADVTNSIREVLGANISLFISDEHRKFVVRCHAQGMSTADAVSELIDNDEVLERLAAEDALGLEVLRRSLIHRVSYLKPGSARWPEKKYGGLWREVRASYKQAISDLPLSSSLEQAAVLVKHVNRINYALENDSYTVKDLQMLTNSLTKTIESLRKVSVVEEQAPANLSAPQLVAVLERLTLALDVPERLALSGDADGLVSVLEQLTFALKASGQKALGEGTEASVQDAEVVSTENGVNGSGRK